MVTSLEKLKTKLMQNFVAKPSCIMGSVKVADTVKSELSELHIKRHLLLLNRRQALVINQSIFYSVCVMHNKLKLQKKKEFWKTFAGGGSL